MIPNRAEHYVGHVESKPGSVKGIDWQVTPRLKLAARSSCTGATGIHMVVADLRFRKAVVSFGLISFRRTERAMRRR